MFVRDKYIVDPLPSFIESVKEINQRFINKCELTLNKGIFNENTSILEPYE